VRWEQAHGEPFRRERYVASTLVLLTSVDMRLLRTIAITSAEPWPIFLSTPRQRTQPSQSDETSHREIPMTWSPVALRRNPAPEFCVLFGLLDVAEPGGRRRCGAGCIVRAFRVPNRPP
jgi:hypothetical protein